MTDGRVRDSHRRRANGGGSGWLAARSTRRAKLTELTLFGVGTETEPRSRYLETLLLGKPLMMGQILGGLATKGTASANMITLAGNWVPLW